VKPTAISLCNDVGLTSKGSENIASQTLKIAVVDNLTVAWRHLSKKPANIRTNLTLPETKSHWATFLPPTMWVYLHSKFLGGLQKHISKWSAIWPFKVIQGCCTNRKRVCNVLLVINSNFGPILHRLWDTATYYKLIKRPELLPVYNRTSIQWNSKATQLKTLKQQTQVTLMSELLTHVSGIASIILMYNVHGEQYQLSSTALQFPWACVKSTPNVDSITGYTHCITTVLCCTIVYCTVLRSVYCHFYGNKKNTNTRKLWVTTVFWSSAVIFTLKYCAYYVQ